MRIERLSFDLFITADYPPTGGGQSTYFELITRSYPGTKTVLTRLLPGTARTETVMQGVDVRRVRAGGWAMPLVFFLHVLCWRKRRYIRFIHCGQLRAGGWACCLLNLLFGIPYGIHVYGGERAKFADHRFWRLVLRPVLIRAACLFANSSWTRNLWIEYGIPAEKIKVINPPVDLNRFHPLTDRARLRNQLDLDNRKVLLSVCRLDPHKGTDRLIEAVALLATEIPDILLIVGGGGRMRGRLEALVQQHALGGHVRFVGRIPDDELINWYNAADLFVMPSREQSGMESGAEGFGIVYLEANACGLPVIAGRSGGTADAVDDGVSGLRVVPESPAVIADAIKRILTSPAFGKQLGRQGMERAHALFRDAVISRQLYDAASLCVEVPTIVKIEPHIAHVITRLDKGGSATNTLVSADRQREHGFGTTLIYGYTADPDGHLADMLAGRSLDVRYLPCLKRNFSPLDDWRAFFKLVSIFRKERFDLVHTHTSKAGLLGRLAAWVCRIPCIHTPHGHIFYGYFGTLVTHVFVWLERLAAPMTARMVSLTDRETEESLVRKIGHPGQFVTIPSGVPLDVFRNVPEDVGRSFRSRSGMTGQSVVFASVGRLTPIKGFDLLITAFADVVRQLASQDIWLVIVGDGEERMVLEALVETTGLAGRVVFTGELQDVTPVLSAADCFVLASRNEGMGRAFVEAMASGLPAIGPATGGVDRVIQDGVTGILFPKEDTAALAAAMVRMATDESFRQQAGQKAMRAMDPLFSESYMVERLCQLYREVLS